MKKRAGNPLRVWCSDDLFARLRRLAAQYSRDCIAGHPGMALLWGSEAELIESLVQTAIGEYCAQWERHAVPIGDDQNAPRKDQG